MFLNRPSLLQTLSAFTRDAARLIGINPVRPYSPIELHVRPLVDCLNVHGFRTYSSCQGHWFEPNSGWVAFMAPAGSTDHARVAALAKRLYDVQLTQDSRWPLHSYWSIEPTFRSVPVDWVPQDDLPDVPSWTRSGYAEQPDQFVIAYRLRCSWPSGWAQGLRRLFCLRSMLNHDFDLLGRLIHEHASEFTPAENPSLVQPGHEHE